MLLLAFPFQPWLHNEDVCNAFVCPSNNLNVLMKDVVECKEACSHT